MVLLQRRVAGFVYDLYVQRVARRASHETQTDGPSFLPGRGDTGRVFVVIKVTSG